ncbi:MAG: 50S ribosome-binding GTPase [Clostridium sp.]|nr:MAG: 50S ribosome-binding GTPase [Clostridium sp.]
MLEKSSLINSLLKRFTAMTSDVIATSVIPGTTLDEITIPFFEDNKAFIDTPGLINDANVLESLLPKSYLTIFTKNGNKAKKSYQLRSGNTILLAGLGGISILEGNTNATIYVANSLYIHRN